MTWINTDYQFAFRAATLTLSRRVACDHGLESVMAKAMPLEIHDTVKNLIRQYRPELVGGVLEGMRFNIESNQWEFRYAHESLPIQHEGCWADRLPLIPDADQPTVTQ